MIYISQRSDRESLLAWEQGIECAQQIINMSSDPLPCSTLAILSPGNAKTPLKKLSLFLKKVFNLINQLKDNMFLLSANRSNNQLKGDPEEILANQILKTTQADRCRCRYLTRFIWTSTSIVMIIFCGKIYEICNKLLIWIHN